MLISTLSLNLEINQISLSFAAQFILKIQSTVLCLHLNHFSLIPLLEQTLKYNWKSNSTKCFRTTFVYCDDGRALVSTENDAFPWSPQLMFSFRESSSFHSNNVRRRGGDEKIKRQLKPQTSDSSLCDLPPLITFWERDTLLSIKSRKLAEG